MIHRLNFDTTDADTIANSSNVGAYLRSADGTLITHTDVGGKKSLDVNVANAITVDVDLDFATDSIDVSGSTVELGATTLAALENITVSATDLDIRNLVFADDKVDVSGSEVSLDSATLAALENITVSATAFDIRALDANTDSISSWMKDGIGSPIGSTGGALHVNISSGSVELGATTLAALEDVNATVNDAALANTAIAAASNTLGTANTAEDVVASPLSNRKYLMIYNNGNKMAYIGQSGVSASNGYPLPAGSELVMRAGAAIDIEWVSSDTSQQIRTLELS